MEAVEIQLRNLFFDTTTQCFVRNFSNHKGGVQVLHKFARNNTEINKVEKCFEVERYTADVPFVFGTIFVAPSFSGRFGFIRAPQVGIHFHCLAEDEVVSYNGVRLTFFGNDFIKTCYPLNFRQEFFLL